MNQNLSSDSPRLPIDTCEGMYEKLKYDYERLQNGWHQYDLFNFTITAFHLYEDWLKLENAGSIQQVKRKNSLSSNATLIFEILRDNANSNKHYILTHGNSIKNMVVAGITKQQKTNWFDYLRTQNGVNCVTLKNGNINISFSLIASFAMQILEWIIQSESDNFPAQLEEHLAKYLQT